MSTWEIVQQAITLFGGTVGLGVVVRVIYRAVSKPHRQALEADTTRDLVNVATSLLAPAEEQIKRLSTRLAEEEARANRLQTTIKELEQAAFNNQREINNMHSQVESLRSQLLEAQLEVGRLRALLSADSGP